MIRKRLVGFLLAGVVLFGIALHIPTNEKMVGAETQAFTKSYLLGLDQPGLVARLPELAEEKTNSPQNIPNYLEYFNYVYQKASYSDQDWEIFFKQNVGTPVNLTNNTKDDIEPDLNTAGTAIVFSTDRNGQYEIYSMNTSGGSVVRLTTDTADEYSPRWSPDASRVVYVSEKNSVPEIFVMNANGSSQTRLTVLPANGDYDPSFSPDGSQIAFVRPEDDFGGRVWVMNANGSDPHPVSPYLLFIGRPAWFPDGSRIVFDADVDGDVWNEIATIQPDGTHLAELVDLDHDNIDAWMGNLSADGDFVFFRRVYWDSYYEESYIAGISAFTMNLESGVISNTSIDTDITTSPDWYQLDPYEPLSSLHPLAEYTRGASVSLEWDFADEGSSGIFQFKPQYRRPGDDEWTALTNDYTLVMAPPFSVTSLVCGKYYFRIRAEDHAENWEAWPDDPGEAWTTSYRTDLFGKVTDNRGEPLPGANLLLGSLAEPLAIGSDGHYHGYGCGTGGSIGGSLAGYGVGAYTSYSATGSIDIGDYYLPPTQNLLQNGTFNLFFDWSTEGVFSPQTGTTAIWNGALLGKRFLKPDPLSTVNHGPGMGTKILKSTADGTRYAAWTQQREGSSSNGAFYAFQLPGQPWSTAVEVSDVSNSPTVLNLRMEVGADGDVSFLWMARVDTRMYDPHDYRYVYRERSSDGTWSDAAYLTDIATVYTISSYDDSLYLGIDAEDHLHAVWALPGGLTYRLRLPDGSWQPEELIDDSTASFAAALSSGGEFNLIYEHANVTPVLRLRRTGAGAWSEAEALPESVGGFSPTGLVVKADGSLAMTWRKGVATPPYGTLYHQMFSEMTSPTEWAEPLDLYIDYSGNGPLRLLIDPLGRMHYIGSNLYWMRRADGTWPGDPVTLFPPMSTESSFLSINPTTNQPEALLWSNTSANTDNNIYSFPFPEIGSTILSQTITIPADMVHPTLAFLYNQATLPASGGFTAAVDGTTVFTGQVTDGWELGWADLGAWSGQSVAVTFKAESSNYEPPFEMSLDNASLGEWATLVLTDVTPGSFIDAWEGQVLTITGQNFVDPVSVRLNEIDLSGVVFVDAGMLQVALPPGLPAGLYTLTVSNPGGQTALKINALRLGSAVYIPMIVK